MKRSNLEIAFQLAGLLFAFTAIFRKPLGLSEAWDWTAPVLVIVCVVPIFILQRRRRNARLEAGLPATEKPPKKSRFWLLLALMAAVTLSGPLWLPYTGTALPTSTLTVTSIISCAFAVLVLVFSWRYWNKKV